MTAISAVLRTWEARFAASVVEVGHATLVLAVAAPLQNEEQALAIAAEMAAFCPPEDMLHAGDFKALAGGLLGTPPPGPVRASHGAQTGGLLASSNTPRPARRGTHRATGDSAQRAPPTPAERSSSDHITRPKLLFGGAGSPHAEIRNRWRAGGNQSQSGRTAAQPGCSRLPDLAPEPWQDTRHPARSEAGHVGPIGSHQTPSMTLCTSSDLDSIRNIRHLLNIDALTPTARSDQHLLDQGADQIALLLERQAVPRTRRGGEVALRIRRL